MTYEDRQYWRHAISMGERWMRPKRALWRRLQKKFRLELSVPGYPEEDLVRIARFYPQCRQIITAIAFNYPTVFMTVEEPEYQYGSEILERVANAALETMRAKREIQQAAFDALFCCLGWLKFDYNPPGSSDIIAPYVLADDLQNDFPCVRRISAFNVIPDPLTPPHALAYARHLIEKMLVPLEFAKKDDRFVHRAEIRPVQGEDLRNAVLENLEDSPFRDGDEHTAFEEAKSHGEMVLLWEVHDRLHRRRITFAEGVDEPIEDIEHPFLEREPVLGQDPVTGEQYPTGEYRNTGGYLVEGGFPYHAIKFDLSDEGLYGLPMMAYVEDEQQVITESATRRADLLKRASRIILGNRQEREENPEVEDQLRDARDGLTVWVNDVDRAFRELPWGQVPQDQLGIESDMRHYEEQVLQVSQLALGGSSRMTATQASLIASFGQLNREWLQDSVAEAYRITVRNSLRIMSDDRYIPDKFLVNFGEDAMPAYQAVTADLLRVKYKIKIEANSMRPLFEQLEKEDTLALVNYLIAIPEIDRQQVIRLILRAFRVPNPEKFVGPTADANEIRAAQLENQFMAGRLQDPGVLPSQDHATHLRAHMQAQQDPAVLQMIQGHMQTNPQAGMALTVLMQQHMTQHQAALQQRYAPNGKPGQAGGTGKAMPSMRDMGTRNPQQVAQNVQSTVRSNAQRVGQQVSINPEQN